jgi:hypothetical protein
MTPEPDLAALTDPELLDRADTLAASYRSVTAALIRTLREIDDRGLYRPLGFASMYTYCTVRLRLSEQAAYSRIEVARVSRAFPAVLEAVEEGALTQTTAVLLAPHLTPDNERELLSAARFKSKREVERLLASRNQDPDALTFVMHFKVDAATFDRFQYARSLLRHQIPDGDTAAIFKKAIGLLIEHVERRKLSLVKAPRRPSARMPKGRTIPSHVQRAVWKRDEARCAFRGTMGRCTERDFLEFHHVRAFAEGGKATIENIELRCRVHNAYEAELMFQA